jgi:hypothetical protein
MKITPVMLSSKLLEIAKENAPVRIIQDKPGRPHKRAVGKPGTNMYSPYPGNLKNNGIYAIKNGIVFDYNKVGYIGYANIRSKKPQFIEKTINDFCNFCVALGGRIKQK